MPRLLDFELTRSEPTNKVSPDTGRVQTLEEIDSRVSSLLDAAGITRVSELTMLDRLGVPVFAAITPMARDLTTHLGKGTTKSAARVSAMMEAIERVSAENADTPRQHGSFNQMRARGYNAINPNVFDLPPSTAFRCDTEFSWVLAWDVACGESAWILEDLAITPPREGVLDQVDTNGLASGATYGEAIRHALLELIERDVVGQHQYFDLYGDEGSTLAQPQRIDVGSVPESTRMLIDQISRANLEIIIEDMRSDCQVPVVSATLIDYAFPTANGPVVLNFGGWGADPAPEYAINRSITEACQSRLSFIQGARDSYNAIPAASRMYTKRSRRRVLQPSPCVDAGHLQGFRSGCIFEDVDYLVESLSHLGIDHVFVVDLSRPDIRLPVVRVRVPGLSLFAVDRKRVGWRSARHLL